MDLVELYFHKTTNSHLDREELKAEIAWLTDSGWSSEQIFFSINYLSKFYLEEMEESLMEAMVFNKKELKKYYQLAKVKRSMKAAKESEVKYDSSNSSKRIDTPQWFRKSINFDLFK